MTGKRFNTGDPVAYFITWTTFGTWLPGDERGWQKWGVGGIQPPNEIFREAARSKLKEAEFALSVQDRKIVELTIEKHCEIRNWTLHQVNARSNHVHVIVTAPGFNPKAVRDQFKAWCTRKLKASHSNRQRFWTEGASCRYIQHEEDLDAAIEYAGDAQERKHLD